MKEDLKLIVPIAVSLMLLASVGSIAYCLPHVNSFATPIVDQPPKTTYRWRFLDDQSGPEVSRKQAKLRLIDEFWRDFKKRVHAYSSSQKAFEDKTFRVWIRERLRKIDPHFEWELGRPRNGIAEFAICMGSSEDSMPIVETMVERAGKIPGWRITSYRLPMDAINVASAFKSRTGRDLPAYQFALEQTTEHGINVTIYSAEYIGDGRYQDMADVFLLTEIVLGEDNLNRWVSFFASRHANPKPGSKFNCAETSEKFKVDFEKMKRQIIATLPDKPYTSGKDDSAWYGFSFDDDYLRRNAKVERLRLASSTTWKDLGKAFQGHEHFFPERWSKFGEHFAYLETISGKGEMTNQERMNFEDTLTGMLEKNKLGCMVASGRGRPETYYFDLALTDPDKAIPLLRQFCKEQKMSKQTWLRFHDYYWRYEWVRMLRDTPDLKHPELPG